MQPRRFDFIIRLAQNRIFILLAGICMLFLVILLRLFDLQIIHGQEYSESTIASVSKTVDVLAPRGSIYDRNGRPLAVNQVAHSVEIDNSITLTLEPEIKQDLLIALCNQIWADEGITTDDLPIGSAPNYEFLFYGADEKAIREQEEAWKSKVGVSSNSTGKEALQALFTKYNAPYYYTEAQKRTFVSYHLNLSVNNIMAITLAQKLTEFGETFIDELPMDSYYPYEFQQTNELRQKEFKQSMSMKDGELDYNALDTLGYLRAFFGLPEGLPLDTARKAVGIRYSIYTQRYQQYKTITIATDINDRTLAYVEENQDVFPNVVASTFSLREYPEEKYFSHILGYIRQMTESDYTRYSEDVDINGNAIYKKTDIVGQAGLEQLYERELNGTDGKVFMEVDNLGRRINVLETTDPIAGKDIFLTLDSQLQKVAFDSLELELKNAIYNKMLSDDPQNNITVIDVFTSMIKTNNISAKKIMRAEEGVSKVVYDQFLRENPDFTGEEEDAIYILQTYLIDALAVGRLTVKQCALLAIEHDTIIATDEEIWKVEQGAISVLTFILNKLNSGELTPSDTGLDPSTGSVFVTRVDSGEVLASVSYPSYDNNELVNVFNNAYYNDLLEDTNTPLVNRPLKQKKAPGSTFKMIPLLAGLETGVININTQIYDNGIFTDAGSPHARCWIYGGYGATHGMVGVQSCLEVSCNYFMYSLAYQMGNVKEGTTTEGITLLNEYMASFGLNKVAGLELGESSPTMASPYYKERMTYLSNPDATESQTRWTDGDTIRAAIGQSLNSYTPAQMTKYISTLANGGTLYQLHMVESLKNADGTMYQHIDEVIEYVTEFDQRNLNAVYEGMLDVGKGSQGTLRNYFRTYDMNVAVKTGTAQEDLNRSSHTWLVGFAPYEDPQIAITIMVPFGDGNSDITPNVFKAIIEEYFGTKEFNATTNLETILNP